MFNKNFDNFQELFDSINRNSFLTSVERIKFDYYRTETMNSGNNRTMFCNTGKQLLILFKRFCDSFIICGRNLSVVIVAGY